MSDEQEQSATETKKKVRITQLLLSDDVRQYIFAEVIDDEGEDILVKHPMALELIPSRDYDGYSVVLHDYMPFAQERIVSINKMQIRAACVPVREMAMYYLAYRERCADEQLEETLISRITDGPAPSSPVDEFDDSPASEHDTKH